MKMSLLRAALGFSLLAFSAHAKANADQDCFEGNWTVEAGFVGTLTASMNIVFDGTVFSGNIRYLSEYTPLHGSFSSGKQIIITRLVNNLGFNGTQTWVGTVDNECKSIHGSWSGVGGSGIWDATKE